jgi:hypothetical protein
MPQRARILLSVWAWRLLVIVPLLIVFLLVALILPMTFLSFFDHQWMIRNPVNSWVLGALIYATTCYILSTSPTVIRLGEWLMAVDRLRRHPEQDQPLTKM